MAGGGYGTKNGAVAATKGPRAAAGGEPQLSGGDFTESGFQERGFSAIQSDILSGVAGELGSSSADNAFREALAMDADSSGNRSSYLDRTLSARQLSQKDRISKQESERLANALKEGMATTGNHPGSIATAEYVATAYNKMTNAGKNTFAARVGASWSPPSNARNASTSTKGLFSDVKKRASRLERAMDEGRISRANLGGSRGSRSGTAAEIGSFLDDL
jgi:hypothetical protein